MEEIVGWVRSAHDRGRAPLVVVAEGFALDTMDDAHSERGLDAFGRPRLGGIGEVWPPSSKRPQELKPGPPRWDTFSAVELPAPLTGSWPHASV